MSEKHMRTVKTFGGGTIHVSATAECLLGIAVQLGGERVELRVDRGGSAVLLTALIAAHEAAFGQAYQVRPPPSRANASQTAQQPAPATAGPPACSEPVSGHPRRLVVDDVYVPGEPWRRGRWVEPIATLDAQRGYQERARRSSRQRRCA